MSIQQTLLKAQRCVNAGQYDAAIRHYRGLLRLTPKHPQVNNLLGTVLIQVGQAEAAAQVLQVALAAEPANPQHWIRLIAALHRAGHVQRARELLPQGVAMGVDNDLMEQLHKSLTEPPTLALQAIDKLVQAGNTVSAEIAARMMVQDYPDSSTAKDCLAMVIQLSDGSIGILQHQGNS